MRPGKEDDGLPAVALWLAEDCEGGLGEVGEINYIRAGKKWRDTAAERSLGRPHSLAACTPTRIDLRLTRSQ